MNAVVASIATFILNVYAISYKAIDREGNVGSIEDIGTTTYTSIIWTVNCQIALMISHFTWISHALIWGSIAAWYIFLYCYSSLPPTLSGNTYGVLTEQAGPAPVYWLTTLLVVIVSLIPYVTYVAVQRQLKPMDDDIIQEIKLTRTDVTDSVMWSREQERSKQVTQVGYTARVDAKIRHLKDQLHRKRKSFSVSLRNSPIYKSVMHSS